MAAQLNNGKEQQVGNIYDKLPEERYKMPGQATILVVDDDKAIRDSCFHTMTYDGYRTETAQDGGTALQKIRNLKPDLVLVDLKMPGTSGMELLRKIGDIDPNIVSVVITGYATVDSTVEAMNRNAFDVLSKPFTPKQLRIVVKRGLAQLIDEKKVTTELINGKKMATQSIDGKSVAGKVKEEVKKEIVMLKEKHKAFPLLLAVQVGENPASVAYLKSQKKGCEEVGIDYQVQQLPQEISQKELIQFIKEKNQDEKITGIGLLAMTREW